MCWFLRYTLQQLSRELQRLIFFGPLLLWGCAKVAPDPGAVVVRAAVDGSTDFWGLTAPDLLPDIAPDLFVACVPNQPCDTTNPGACQAGHTQCSNNVALCVPDTTIQSCYSGATGTAGVGICRSGTQSCIDALGPCNGEVLPAIHEDCLNELDDDCDGKTNGGCPDHLLVGSSHVYPLRGATGTKIVARCPANSLVTGLRYRAGQTGNYLQGADLTCASPRLGRDTTGYSVSLTQVPATGYAASFSAQDGFRSATAQVACSTGPFGASSGGVGSVLGSYIEGLGLWCSTIAVSLDANNQLIFGYTIDDNNSIYYEAGAVSGTRFSDECGPNEVLVGYDAQVGTWVTGVQTVCAPLVVVYK